MLPRRRSDLVLALSEPDEVRRRSWRQGELLFVRHSGEGDIVVVVTLSSEPENDIDAPRTWVVTAYVSGNAPLSEVLWIAQ
jgi:hypothetical protein